MADTSINLQTEFDKTRLTDIKDLSEDEILKIQKTLKEQKEVFNTQAINIDQNTKELNNNFFNFLDKNK